MCRGVIGGPRPKCLKSRKLLQKDILVDCIFSRTNGTSLNATTPRLSDSAAPRSVRRADDIDEELKLPEGATIRFTTSSKSKTKLKVGLCDGVDGKPENVVKHADLLLNWKPRYNQRQYAPSLRNNEKLKESGAACSARA